MKVYNKSIVIRANEIGLVTEDALLDACQELMDAKTKVDLGSVFSANLGKVQVFGDDAINLFTRLHKWRLGEVK